MNTELQYIKNKKIKYNNDEHKWLVELYINKYYNRINDDKKGMTRSEIKNHFSEYKARFVDKSNRPWNSFRAWCKNLEYLLGIEKKSLPHFSYALKKELKKQLLEITSKSKSTG